VRSAVLEHEAGRMADAGAVRNLAVQARKSIDRAGAIIRTLRSFLSNDERNRTLVRLSDVTQEALSLALPQHERQDISVSVHIEPADLTLIADRVQLQQVLVNFVRNSAEAMAGQPGTAHRLEINASKGSRFALVSLRDSGPGFAPAVLARERLPADSATGVGMGLGLLICRRIVEDHGGHLRLLNHPQGGALIRFSLPIGGVTD
jgi:two-component system, LuxR family, sensor kinase FixL